jgi:hypothetical protein
VKPGGAPQRTVRPGRRRALGLLGLGLLGAVAGRGGPGRPTHGDGRDAAGAARADAGPSPTPTPTPREDRNKLGLHVNVWTFEAAAMVRWTDPAAVKVLDSSIDLWHLYEYRRRRPDGLVILRVLGNDRLEALGAAVDRTLRVADRIARFEPVVEVPVNEAHQSGSALRAYADATSRAVERIAAAGYRPAVGNFSVGNPPRLRGAHVEGAPVPEESRDWPLFYPALAAARRVGGYLSLHEFWTPENALDTWHALRYRRVWAELPAEHRLPVLITECGIDRALLGRPQGGWQVYRLTAEQCAEQLRRYRDALAEDPYVHAAVVFACGTFNQWPRWRSYDVAGVPEVEAVLAEAVDGPPLWRPEAT